MKTTLYETEITNLTGAGWQALCEAEAGFEGDHITLAEVEAELNRTEAELLAEQTKLEKRITYLQGSDWNSTISKETCRRLDEIEASLREIDETRKDLGMTSR